MNKTELVARVAEISKLTKKDADKAVSAFVEAVIEGLKADDKIQIAGFGTFEARTRAARTGINPRTKETITIAATKVPAFKAGKPFKDAVK